jgi:hypothetical protein
VIVLGEDQDSEPNDDAKSDDPKNRRIVIVAALGLLYPRRGTWSQRAGVSRNRRQRANHHRVANQQ